MIVNIGSISFYLSLKLEQDQKNKVIKLSQPVYINKVFRKYKTNIINTSIKKTKALTPSTNNKALALERKIYHRIIRSLKFSMIETRPDITFVILVVSKFAKIYLASILKLLRQFFDISKN